MQKCDKLSDSLMGSRYAVFGRVFSSGAWPR